MNTSNETLSGSLLASIADGAQRVTAQADESLRDTHQALEHASRTMAESANAFRGNKTGALTDAAAKTEEFARRGMARAREMSTHARERATVVRDATAERVQAQPMKALLVAAAAGAATAMVVQWLSHSRRNY